MSVSIRSAGLAIAFACFSLSATAVDQVIFKDGFSITGRRVKEQESISDPSTGTRVVIPKIRGFDYIETGSKIIIFSNKVQQVGKLLENVRGDSDFKEYKKDVYIKGRNPLPQGIIKVGEFNDKWTRIIRVDMPAIKGFAEIEQKIATIGPSRIVMPSTNYSWYPYYDIHEFDPSQVRKFLVAHEELKEKPGEPDVGKRLDLAQFFKDAGWLDQSLKEIADAKVAIPTAWPKDLQERAEKLTSDIQLARTTKLVQDLEKAVRAGQYQRARERAAQFDEKQADTQTSRQYSTLKAQIEIVEPRFQKAKRLLRSTLDQLVGLPNHAAGALGGGSVVMPLKTQPQQIATLLTAGEQVYIELHPDTTERLDFFLSLAEQAERRIAAKQDSGTSPEKLAALAVTGWLKGKNGAEQDVNNAVRYWMWRDMLLAYQREPILNNRRSLYLNMSASNAILSPDEIAQLISYLPPSQPENLAARTGTLVDPGVYRRNTGPVPETAKGVDYLVRLPSEYHHGRPCRLLLTLTTNNLPVAQMVSLLAPEADRNGYIIIAPDWVSEFENNFAYDFKGDKHYMARAVLRDALRLFRIDNDRVFLFGYGEGANFAMDLGASHPDQFAGVVAMGPNPKHFNMFMHYWRNCQKLPVYACIGSIAGDAFQNLRKLFENWMDKGYPAIGVVYRGRGMEWFAPEVPVMFDWMEPKKRVLGTAVLRLNEPVEPWISMRNADDRFYWVGSDKLDRQSTLDQKGSKSFTPAEINADIRQGNQIVLRTRGTNNIVLWFDRNMIDWSKPISVSINGTTPAGYKAKVLQPDVELMLEQLYQHGDRSLLFLNRLEFPTVR